MNDKPAQRKLKKKRKKGGKKDGGDPDVCPAVFDALSTNGVCITGGDIFEGFLSVGVDISIGEADMIMSLLGDDNCLDPEEFESICQFSLIGAPRAPSDMPFRSRKLLLEGDSVSLNQLLAQLAKVIALIREQRLPNSFWVSPLSLFIELKAALPPPTSCVDTTGPISPTKETPGRRRPTPPKYCSVIQSELNAANKTTTKLVIAFLSTKSNKVTAAPALLTGSGGTSSATARARAPWYSLGPLTTRRLRPAQNGFWVWNNGRWEELGFKLGRVVVILPIILKILPRHVCNSKHVEICLSKSSLQKSKQSSFSRKRTQILL